MASKMKRRISALTRDRTNFMIGIASSGHLKSRWTAVCKCKRMNSIIKVYETGSVKSRDSLFEELKEFYKDCEGFECDPYMPRSNPDTTWIIYLACNDTVSLIDFALHCTIIFAHILHQSVLEWNDEGIDEGSLIIFDRAYVQPRHIITGRWKEALPTAIKFVMSQVQASPFWIGATSNGHDGCRSRWNVTYKWRWMNHMAPVYKTDSDASRDQMEKELIKYFQHSFPTQCQNVNAGGGGPIGDAPHIIYVVW